MTEDSTRLSDELSSALALARPPIAAAFLDTVPDGVPEFRGTVPAGCVFWQAAAERTFSTSARDHSLCAIGIHTLHLSDAPSTQTEELQASLQAMVGLDYVREEEVAGVPVRENEAKHAVYGPLAGFPVSPDVVLLFADGRQGLILSEAIERVDGDSAPAMGRPACAVIPRAVNRGASAMSLGCCGARAYLDSLSDDVALWALPGAKLPQYCGQVTAFARANRTLATFHGRRRTDVESGGRPTVGESLARLS